jgi:hypothetical protein
MTLCTSSYWQKADVIAQDVYNQLFSQIKSRGKNVFTGTCPLEMNYKKDVCEETSMFIDYEHTILTDRSEQSQLVEPDNMGLCLSADDYCEIAIITFLPKYYRVKNVIESCEFQCDFLNVLRHEIEHMFQDGAYQVDEINLNEYDRSDSNFLLQSAEVPAYVHGFRLSTNSYSDFKEVISEFITAHGTSLSLSKNEINHTTNVWLKFLKNLNYSW